MATATRDISIPIGYSETQALIYLSAELQRLHSLILTMNDDDRVRLQGAMVAGRIVNRLAGLTDESIVVIDPDGGLTDHLLDALDSRQAVAVRWLDYRTGAGAPRLNLLSPGPFGDRDVCVDSLVSALRGLCATWGNRLEDTVRSFLELAYEHNRTVTSGEDGLSVADGLRLPVSFDRAGRGRVQTSVPTGDLARALERCEDADVCAAVRRFLGYPPETKAELFAALSHQVGRALRDCRAGDSVLECRSTSAGAVPDLAGGDVVVLSAGARRMGRAVAAFLSSWLVANFWHAVLSRDSAPGPDRPSLLACDSFVSVRGAPWLQLLAESRKYGLSLCLADGSLPGNDRTMAGYLANSFMLLAGRLNQVDAARLVLELPGSDVTDFTAAPPGQFRGRTVTPRDVSPPFRLLLAPSD